MRRKTSLVILAAISGAAFACSENRGPTILETTRLLNTSDTIGPYLVTAVVTDPDGVASVQLVYSTNGVNATTVEMQRTTGDVFSGFIPGQPDQTTVVFYLTAADQKGATSADPGDAPANAYWFRVSAALASRVCQTDSECRAMEVCDRASHRCRPRVGTCVRDEDCGTTEVCNMATRQCIARERSCTRSSDCLDGEVCEPVTNKCVERPPDCGPNGECPNGYVCDRATNHCLRFRCTSDNDCGPGRICNLASEQCVAKPCANDAECGACRVCDPSSRACLACAVGQVCESNVCKPAGTCGATTCQAPRPVCDPTDASCVECLANGDCDQGGGAGLPRICDRTQRKCVLAPQCTSDSDCPSSEMCNTTTKQCVPRPPECDANRPCATPKVCDSVTGLCIDRACRSDSQCPPGYACDSQSLICKVLDRCRNDGDCPGKRCDTASGACVACLTTTDCARGQTCDTTTHTCKQATGACSTSGTCSDAQLPYCETASWKCVACLTNAHCGAGKVCTSQYKCETAPPAVPLCKVCSSSGDCGTDGLCAWSDGRRNFCTKRCGSDGDCGTGYKCNGQINSTTCEPASGQCAVPCASATDCKSDETCVNGQCELRTGRGLCEACTSDNDCGGPNDNCLTNGREQFCGRACSRNAPCPTGYSCLQSPTGGGRQCFPNTLECPRTCVTAANCRTGETCTNGQCVPATPPKDLCESCSSNAECGTGNACIPYPSGSACGRDCASTACPSGYFCARMQGVSQCVKSNFSCSGTTPIDAGFPPPPIDAGFPPPPPWDAGWPPPYDAGLPPPPPPIDAGWPPYDAGFPPPPPFDAGWPPYDAGQPPPVDAGPPPPPCTEDAYEPNDSIATAKPLALGYYSGLCLLNEDYFSIAMDGTRGFRVEIFFTNAAGNLDLDLIGPDGVTRVATARTNGNGEAVSLNSLPAGTYTIRVFGRNGAQNAYSLQLSYVFIPQCIDDRFEPNDSSAAASTIRAGVQAGLQVCAGNDDYFRYTTAANRVLTVTAAFTNTAGNLDLDVTSPSGSTTTIATNMNTERLRIASTEAGAYVIRVFGRSGAQNSYTLSVQDQGGLCGTCSMDQDCGDQGARCLPLPGGSRCGRACTQASDCPSGFNCMTQFGINQCVPNGFSCP